MAELALDMTERPDPVARRPFTFSKSRTDHPMCLRAIAADKPPSPVPTIRAVGFLDIFQHLAPDTHLGDYCGDQSLYIRLFHYREVVSINLDDLHSS